METDGEFFQQVKEKMGYTESTCQNCEHFVPSNEASGENTALPDHCARNCFPLPVKQFGRCEHYTHPGAKKKK